MTEKALLQRSAANPSEVAEELLEPVLSFLKQAGISEANAARAFKRAWSKSSAKRSSAVALESLKDPQPYVDLVSAWSRQSEFLSKEGLPRDLPVSGRNGFSSMVRKVAPALDPKKALLLLHAYGNVEKLPGGKVRLTKPFFHIKSDRQLAFEPSVRFLLDAARNVKQSLHDSSGKGSRARAPAFWRTVDSKSLPAARSQAYLAFVKELSLTFLQDVDDWLSENSVETPGRIKAARVGLGLFTIGTTPE